jgi:putative transposase
LAKRVSFLREELSDLSTRKKCELLNISRSVIYYEHKNTDTDIWLINLIRDIWLEHPFYGYRKISVVLNIKYGVVANRKCVLRLMKMAGIEAIYPKPKLSIKNNSHKVYPYLLRSIIVNYVNHVWQVDITYLKLGKRFVYLVALIDVHSRYIVGPE